MYLRNCKNPIPKVLSEAERWADLSAASFASERKCVSTSDFCNDRITSPLKEESVKSKPIKIGELVSAFVLDLTTARRQKERGKKNEEKNY